MDRIDIAVIGSGPAGVSAAITAKARNKNVRLFRAHGIGPKVAKAHLIRNYPGLPEISGAEFADALERHLAAMEISIVETQVSAVYAMGDYFAIQAADGMHEATSVILASGVSQGTRLPGEDELLGRGVSYCATCDGSLYRGKTVAVLGYGGEADAETEFLAELAAQVLYFPAGGKTDLVGTEGVVGAETGADTSGDAGDSSAAETATSGVVRIIAERPTAILGERRAEAVQTARGSYPVDGVFVLRDSVAPDRLVPGLAMEGGHARVDLDMRTNLPGCFACGDIAGKPYQYVKAAGQGNVAALSAVSYLAERQRAKATAAQA